ncbi:MAG TPA: cupredoxin domain-containing protein [Solirubrobacteraceae bacterium]|nr:cupredoxin domain-containing protein [Solirubrobacteraceae bacterium]
MRRTLTALVLATALLAGCGGDDEEQPAATPEATQEEPASGGGGGATVDVSSPADGSLKFDQSELTAKAGKVTFNYDNPSSVPHAFEVEGNGVEEETETITQADASITVDLKPGEYTYYCPVGQHRQAGMEGTLTVE